MTNCWRVFVILWLTSTIFAKAVDRCSAQPTATVVVVGERVSLNCTANGDFSIISWQIGTDVYNKTVIYTAPQFGPNGTVRTRKYVADGYSVSNVAENKISLHINQIKVSQAGLYVCQCRDQWLSTATTAVVVLASEPKFSVISSVTNGQEVSFACNISFKGSADVSSNLKINDVSGITVNRTVCSPNNALTFCNLKYTITANASIDQSYTCSVQLITNNSIIYSRIVNTSLEWQRVSRAEVVASNPGKCSAEKCVLHESIICKTDGTPGITDFKWWQMRHNGSKLQIEDNSQRLVLNEVGQFTYQCQVYNKIRGVTYNATSKPFAITVTENDNSPPILIVIGISIAIGVIAIIIAIVVVRICCFGKQKNRSPALYAALDLQTSSEERQRETYTAIQLPIQSQQGLPDSPALYTALELSEERQRETYTAIQLPIQPQQDLPGSPALYAALDAQTASEERQREAYTAIQFPIQSQQGLRGDYMNTDFSSEYETVI